MQQTKRENMTDYSCYLLLGLLSIHIIAFLSSISLYMVLFIICYKKKFPFVIYIFSRIVIFIVNGKKIGNDLNIGNKAIISAANVNKNISLGHTHNFMVMKHIHVSSESTTKAKIMIAILLVLMLCL